jgi:hypothetical protein
VDVTNWDVYVRENEPERNRTGKIRLDSTGLK